MRLHNLSGEDDGNGLRAAKYAGKDTHDECRTRELRLLLRLSGGERCVTELAEAEGEKLATVSARLKLLHGARLVTRRREAKHIHYSLADGHVVRLLKDVLDHAAEHVAPVPAPEVERREGASR